MYSLYGYTVLGIVQFWQNYEVALPGQLNHFTQITGVGARLWFEKVRHNAAPQPGRLEGYCVQAFFLTKLLPKYAQLT